MNAPLRNDIQAVYSQELWVILMLFCLGSAIDGVTLECLWNWFIASIGAPRLTWLHAVGLMLLLRWVFTSTRRASHVEADAQASTSYQQALISLVQSISLMPVAIGLGCVLHSFL
jgi:hypothetical protein